MVKFILLAADAVSSVPQAEVKAGACEWLAFGVIVSLGLFICYHLFWDNDYPPSNGDGSVDEEYSQRSSNPDHELWV